MKKEVLINSHFGWYVRRLSAANFDGSIENEECEDDENNFYRASLPEQNDHKKSGKVITVKAGHKSMGEIIRTWEITRYDEIC